MQNEVRKQKALEILTKMGLKNLEYLGQGHSGVVFNDTVYIYKVHLPLDKNNKWEIIRRLSYFINIGTTKHLYNVEIIDNGDVIIEKRIFEKSIPCVNFREADAISILTELWQKKIIIKDCKPHNCVVVNDVVKIIDLDGCEYNDNLFYNLCVRMFLYINYFNHTKYADFQKLQRSAINNFNISELDGAREFVNKVFANIIFEESKLVFKQYSIPNGYIGDFYDANSLPNLEHLFFNGIKENKYLTDIKISELKLVESLYFEPTRIAVSYNNLQPLTDKVTLLIKTCAQDENTVEATIKHIVSQLSSPNPFFEVVVSIDAKQNDFLREYNSNGSLEGIINKIEKLQKDRVIDRFFVFDVTKTEEINNRWFKLPSKCAHTVKNIPVSSQLYAFEQCNGDYILQADCDVIIGRKDYEHSFLTDMLSQLKQNEKVISVGFNIYNKESKEYFGFENGGFVPEVRLGLFDKKRFFALRPYPNELDNNGKLKLSWYRSVEQFQKQSGYCSIRGGDNRTFYIHPQNYRKKDYYAFLSLLDKVEQMQIPDVQFGGFDCEGSFYDWCSPKRNEKMVVVSCFRNVSIPRFLRFWCSLMSQSFQEFGIILYNDCSDNGLSIFIDKIITPYRNRITLINAKFKDSRLANVYRAIHFYCNNPESIIVMADGDDALIGQNALENIYKKYLFSNADVVVGRMHQTYRLQPYYRYPVDFCNPRINGGNVWQHIKSFKKYLFDSIPLIYFKKIVDDEKVLKNKWFETCDDFAIMIPIADMCNRPLQSDFINYYYERDYQTRNADRDIKEKCIAEILNKPALSSENVFIGRKTFRPDFNRIEIDITYDCNLKCLGCNRSCAQAPTKEQIDIKSIEKFVSESIDKNTKWRKISVLGGEPTLHKDFLKIIKLLQNYADKYSQNTIIKVVSNGITEQSRNLCETAKNTCKNVVIDYASFKTNNKIEYFSPFNDAPVDDINFKNADYTKACWVTSYCGIGLNARGFFACAVCGGIDRVLNSNLGVDSFSDLTEDKLTEHFNKFCRLCGNFKHYDQNAGNFIPRCEKEPFRNIVSKTWKKNYGKN